MLAPNTIRSYGYDWKRFEKWCTAQGLTAFPASSETVKLFLADMLARGKTVTNAERHASGIAHKHRIAAVQSPITADIAVDPWAETTS
jgi:site-specific recombinase XerD